jgi:CubicO group peptidase (beta-lactamase class C family)
VDACVQGQLAASRTPGASVAVGLDGAVAYTQGYGVKHAENGGAIDAETVFRIGTSTRLFTAAAVLRLVEAGNIDLAAPLTHYVSDLAIAGAWPPADMTVGQLLSESSGYPDQVLTIDSPLTLDQWLALQDKTSLLAPPGSLWYESVPGWSLAALALEGATGRYHRDYIEAEVFDRAGLQLTTFDAQAVMAHGNWAWGHDINRRFEPDDWDNLWASPAAFVFSTPADLVKWLNLLMAGGGLVISPASAAEITRAHADIGPLPERDYGYGAFLDSYLGVAVAEQQGSFPGWSSKLLWSPERRFAVAITGNARTVFDQAARCALRAVLGLAEPTEPPDHSTDPATWGRYAGTYAVLDDGGRASTTRVNWTGAGLDLVDVASGRTTALRQVALDQFTGDRAGTLSFLPAAGQPDVIGWYRTSSSVALRVGDYPAALRLWRQSCGSLPWTSALDVPESRLAIRATGIAPPIEVLGHPVSQDDPDDPATAGYKHDLVLPNEALSFEITLRGGADDDLDLYLLHDANGDGAFDFDSEQLAHANTQGPAVERIALDALAPPGRYQVWVHGYDVQGNGSTFDLTIDARAGQGMHITGAPEHLEAGGRYTVEVCLDLDAVGGAAGPVTGDVVFDLGLPPRQVTVPVTWRNLTPAYLPALWRLWSPRPEDG